MRFPYARLLFFARGALVACVVLASSAALGAPRNVVLSSDQGTMASALEVISSSAGGCEARFVLPPLPPLDQAGPASLPTYHGFVAVSAGQAVSARATVNAQQTLAGEPTLTTPPAPTIALGEPAMMNGLRVVPFTIDPRLDQTTVATDISLAFEFNGPADLPAFVPESFDRIFNSLILNWDTLRDDVEVGLGTYLMVMPSDSQVSTALQPLIAWRKRQGYNVVTVSVSQAEMTADTIKGYIQGFYDTVQPPLEYICLVGDANGTVALSTWHEGVSGYYGEGDHYYTTLAGNDILADAHVGRLSVRSAAELSGVVTKILGYEVSPPLSPDPGWFTRGTLTGDPSGSGITTVYCQQWLRAQLERVGYTQLDTIYTNPFASRMYSSCSNGVSVFAYRGYLGVSGFDPGYIDNLNNGGKLPFAVLPTCASGSFASDSHSYTEAFLRNPTGGAIGAIGTATTGTHTRFNNCFFSGVWEGIINSGDRHLGAAHTRGKLEMYSNFQANEPNAVEIWSMWNNLMGDPATEMWQAQPRALTVTYPAQLPVGAGAVPVTVTFLGAPVVGARVAVTRNDPAAEVRSVGYSGAGGRITLPLPDGQTAGTLLVTVTGPDLLPHQGSLVLGAVNAFASVSALHLDDGGDGQANPTENLQLTLALTNLGSQTASAVNAVVVSEDPLVQITQGAASFGDLAAGATVWGGPFTLQIDPAAPDGLLARLRVAANSGNATWVSLVEVPVVAARPVVDTVLWDDEMGGGDPGSTRILRVALRNDGSRAASAATVVLTSRSRHLLPAGPTEAVVGAMPVGGTRYADFRLSVAPEAEGQVVSVGLTVTTAEGSRHALAVSLPIGAVTEDSPTGPDAYGYVCFDNLDPAPEAPVYAWIELDPAYFGHGTSVGLTDFGGEQDDTETLALPFAFGYCGQDFTSLAVCSNGWAALGATTLKPYHNLMLPSANSPDAMLAVFWDDLFQTGTNRVYWHYDAPEGRFIVQWARMQNSSGGVQNCEIILYDPAVHPTATGDGLIVMQYAAVDNNDGGRAFATVGIQNLDGTDGLTYTYYNAYAPGARALAPGRAIAFVPMPAIGANGFAVTPAEINVMVAPGAQADVALSLAASGAAGTFASYTLTVAAHLTVAPASGLVAAGQSAPAVLTVDATGLAEGTYELSLNVASTAGAPFVVPVHLVVGVATPVDDQLPRSLVLAPAMPNPFNPRTELSFALPTPGPVRLTVHDLAGRCVAVLVDEARPAGLHRVTWDGVGTNGSRLSSGTYLARLVVAGEVKTTKLTMVK
jgi:hypothetical protein